jgi:hypothetical protein
MTDIPPMTESSFRHHIAPRWLYDGYTLYPSSTTWADHERLAEFTQWIMDRITKGIG